MQLGPRSRTTFARGLPHAASLRPCRAAQGPQRRGHAGAHHAGGQQHHHRGGRRAAHRAASDRAHRYEASRRWEAPAFPTCLLGAPSLSLRLPRPVSPSAVPLWRPLHCEPPPLLPPSPLPLLHTTAHHAQPRPRPHLALTLPTCPLQIWAHPLGARRAATGCSTPSTARAALWACASTRSASACCRTGRSRSACWDAPTCRSGRFRMTMAAQVGGSRAERSAGGERRTCRCG
jgi:hypothetical protein